MRKSAPKNSKGRATKPTPTAHRPPTSEKAPRPTKASTPKSSKAGTPASKPAAVASKSAKPARATKSTTSVPARAKVAKRAAVPAKAAPPKKGASAKAAPPKAAPKKAEARAAPPRPAAKAAPSKRPAVAPVATKVAPKTVAAKPVAARPQPRPALRPAPPPVAPVRVVPKPPKPKLADALKAFDAAIKLFQRGNFATAKESFLKIRERYANQTEIVARVDSYLRICESRLKAPQRIPQTPDALYDQGVLEMNRAHFETAIDYFKRALKSQPHQPHVLYSLAASQVRSGKADEGLATLERAVEAKEINRSHARNDPDFAALRTDERFQELVGLMVM